MPYEEIADLPESVRSALPEHAQEIYLAAFNKTWPRFQDKTDQETTCHRIAWSAVKKAYEKIDGKWVARA